MPLNTFLQLMRITEPLIHPDPFVTLNNSPFRLHIGVTHWYLTPAAYLFLINHPQETPAPYTVVAVTEPWKEDERGRALPEL